jgi:amino acid adenylation domain-containing protein
VRVQVGSVGVADAVVGMQRQLAELLAHEHAPLALAQRASGVVGGSPLFTSLLNFRHSAQVRSDAEVGIEGVDLLYVHERTNYPLAVSVDDTGTGFRLDVLAVAPIDADEVCTMLHTALGGLVEALDNEPGRSVAQIGVLDSGQRERVLAEWNATAWPVPEMCAPELFEAQVSKSPDAVAVAFEDREVTYAELNAQANRLARLLIARGVGPESVVAVAMERSIDLVVSLLAILKAGGAYLPVDPDHPAARIEFVLDDVRPVCVLSSVAVADRVSGAAGSVGVPVVAVDDALVAGDLAGLDSGSLSEEETAGALSPGHPAYVIFTSGSTGRPKGVMVPHSGMVNRLLWMQHAVGLTDSDRVLQKTPAVFDVSVWEFFLPLISGAALVMATPGGHRDPAYLAGIIKAQRITTAHFVPVMLDSFLREPAAAGCTSLVRVICSGEALGGETAVRAGKTLPAARVYNLYGPTEAAVDVTWHECDVQDPAKPPIGRPVWNTQMYVLGDDLQPVASGVAGELYIAGVQLARGYFGRPGLTSERFIACPFGAAGARMYRTGDLASRDGQGRLHFVGRVDDQVKIRGFRVELGEIDAVAGRSAGVDRALTVLGEDPAGDKRLVTYVVPDQAAGPLVARYARMRRVGELGLADLHELHDGSMMLAPDRSVIEFVHKGIFDHGEYLRSGLTIPDGAVVIDVGAHIGTFAVLIDTVAADTRIHAFEPSAELSDLLRANAELNGLNVVLTTCELDDKGRTLSQVIRERGLTVVDLLRISAGESELSVLRGIESEHWPLVRQVVAEVYDNGGRLKDVLDLLESHGLRTIVDCEAEVAETGSCVVYAVRPGAISDGRVQPDPARAAARLTPGRFLSGLRADLARQMPEYMVPSALVVLDEFPLTANGKVDRKALPEPGGAMVSRGGAPRTGQEQLVADLFAELLGADSVGIGDNFFELGGHSLLAVSLVERLRERGVQVGVRALFASPTVAGLAAAVGVGQVEVPAGGVPVDAVVLVPEMVPLAGLDLRELAVVAGQVPGGVGNISDVYPLAPLQEGIFFHHVMAAGQGENDVYVQPVVLGFDSRDRLDGFLAALQHVVDRHDVLRTAVVWHGLSKPVQVVVRRAVVPVVELDPLNQGTDEVGALLAAGGSPMDLGVAPLLRISVAERAAGGWLALVQFHHLIQDHTGLEVLLGEVATLLQGRGDELPEPLPFRNFVAQARLGVSQREHEEYFAELLGDVEEVTAPFGLLDVHQDGSLIGHANLVVDQQVADRVRGQARRLGVSAATVFHLAWARVVAATSGRRDVVFGTVLFGRMQAGVGADRVPGLFINTLPVRVRVGSVGVADAVVGMQRQLAELLVHEHASLALAQRVGGVEGGGPLFTSLFNFRHSPRAESEARVRVRVGIEGVELLHVRERTNYPLAVSVDDTGSGFRLDVLAVAPIDADEVCVMLRTALGDLVQALDNEPGRPVAQIGVLGTGQRERVLMEWNATARPVPEVCVPELFEAQVSKSPDTIAVAFEDREITYAELNAQANCLARFLIASGVGPESVVAVAMERSIDLVVSLLAILKAGAAYLPVDLDYPGERIAYMLDDAKPVLALCDSTGSEVVTAATGVVPVVVVGDPATAGQLAQLGQGDVSDRERCAPLCGWHPAYVIYTSGSTGRPKGVVVGHQGVVNLVTAQLEHLGVGPNSRVLQFASMGFDAAVWELVMAVCSGGRLVLARRAEVLPGADLVALVGRSGVTHVTLPPVVLGMLEP